VAKRVLLVDDLQVRLATIGRSFCVTAVFFVHSRQPHARFCIRGRPGGLESFLKSGGENSVDPVVNRSEGHDGGLKIGGCIY
jgi:hypothetical protein